MSHTLSEGDKHQKSFRSFLYRQDLFLNEQTKSNQTVFDFLLRKLKEEIEGKL